MTNPEPPADAPKDATLAEVKAEQDKLKAEQDRQGSAIDEILGILKGDRDNKSEPASTTTDPPAPDITAQVKEAIRAVNAETADGEKGKPKPEVKPREAGQPFRERLAGVIHGKEPKR